MPAGVNTSAGVLVIALARPHLGVSTKPAVCQFNSIHFKTIHQKMDLYRSEDSQPQPFYSILTY